MKNLFGRRIKELLQEKRIKQSDLAKNLNVTEACISYWVNGKKQPTADNIIAVCQFFDVTADYLLGLTDY
jgi:transcriptional regulator with XRE-family HTH domain